MARSSRASCRQPWPSWASGLLPSEAPALDVVGGDAEALLGRLLLLGLGVGGRGGDRSNAGILVDHLDGRIVDEMGGTGLGVEPDRLGVSERGRLAGGVLVCPGHSAPVLAVSINQI